MDTEKQSSWLERVEALAAALEGSSVGELALIEGTTEITIRRNPEMVLTSVPTPVMLAGQPAPAPGAGPGRTPKVDTSIPVIAPLTGVYYSSPSPTTPSFVNIGDVIHVGQVVALLEAMKVFNEIDSEVSGRVVAIVPTNGNVVQKGDVLLRVEPV
ncbi:acetyl-CoA carboxylase biotin carboxyl carrier protein [Dictyobacter arantiisoli]|uniref:Biotin carboxyl carrier protein of acetyl-CoA carboxylase n=1 Tax=Dictyobacter arantiisoli TaxID=2014874 RepID=A0A5A5T7D1_9CHLR|nr:biotin/lipoyl-containing protein [Dictyobacter arantiisoli]GCF06834.1 acetyl-CoA carboxylase, biotin carboxyl carrier protein [Dictyobacter arantiisoli]